jgi:very-short-patch-repair endonuclease
MSVSVARVVRAVVARGGIARTRELKGDGMRGREIAAAFRSGALLRPRNGLYVLPTTPCPEQEALSHGGLVGCVTAARSHGLWTLDGGEGELVHTWVRPDRHPGRVAMHPDVDESGCCVFHRDIPVETPGPMCVGIVHCLAQLWACRGPETFFAALESALRQGKLSAKQRAVLRRALPERARWLVDEARSDADSGLESLLRLRLRRLGLTVLSQVRIPGVGVVDFVIGDCLILEADGGTHDTNRHRDLVRDAVAVSLGFVTLRFDYAMIVHEWPVVQAAILAALGHSLHRSPLGLRVESETH